MSQADKLLQRALDMMDAIENISDMIPGYWFIVKKEIQTYLEEKPLETKHFKAHETACKCGCGGNVSFELLNRLELLRQAIGNKSIIIRSGFRCPAYNDKVKGARYSQHLKGNAADIIVPGMTTWEVGAYAVTCGFSGIGIGSSITHVDIRPVTDMSFDARERGYSQWFYNSAYRRGRFWAALRGME